MSVVNFAQNSQFAAMCPQCVGWMAGQTHVVANLMIGIGFLDMLLFLEICTQLFGRAFVRVHAESDA